MKKSDKKWQTTVKKWLTNKKSDRKWQAIVEKKRNKNINLDDIKSQTSVKKAHTCENKSQKVIN